MSVAEAELTDVERKGRRLDLSERVDAAHTAVIVIDVQNDFCHQDGIFGRLGYDMSWMDPAVERMRALLAEARRQKLLTVFVRGHEDGRYLSVPMAETYNRRDFKHGLARKGTWGAEWYELLPTQAPHEVNFAKHRFSSFEDTPLDLHLRSNGIKTLITTGVITSGCVEATVRDAFSRGYYVVVPSDCVADATQVRHQASLDKIEQSFGDLTTSEEIMAVWRNGDAAPRHWTMEWKSDQALKDLSGRIDPAHSALVLVDMQHDFCGADGVLARGGDDVTAIHSALPSIASLLEAARAANAMVIHVATEHDDLSASAALLTQERDHMGSCCRRGTPGAAFVEAVAPRPDEEVVVKHRMGAFSDTRLELLLRSNGIRTTVIAGVGAGGAVESTVRGAADKDFYVVVPRDCVASPGRLGELDAPAFEAMARYFARVVPSKEITSVWRG